MLIIPLVAFFLFGLSSTSSSWIWIRGKSIIVRGLLDGRKQCWNDYDLQDERQVLFAESHSGFPRFRLNAMSILSPFLPRVGPELFGCGEVPWPAKLAA